MAFSRETTWAAARTAATALSVASEQSDTIYCQTLRQTNPFYFSRRVFFNFDTSALDDTATIT
jgi:hypothetical protein